MRLAAVPAVPASTATRRGGGGGTQAECKNCGAAAPLFCKSCAAALCASCSAALHSAPATVRLMGGHKPLAREDAAFDILVARLGGDLPCVSEALQAGLPCGDIHSRMWRYSFAYVAIFIRVCRHVHIRVRLPPHVSRARAQAALPVGGLARAAERVVLAGLKAAAASILADDEELRRRVIMVSGSVTPAEMAARLGALGHRAGAAIERTLAANGRLGSHVAVVTGPFPVIITTNWDELLEAGYRLLRYCEDQITCPGRCVGGARARGAVHPTVIILFPRSQHRGVYTRAAGRGTRGTVPQGRRAALCGDQVRPAAVQVGRVHSACAPRRPRAECGWFCRLWKLHGDFSERGRDEFVCGHADYRKLITNDVGCLNLLKHMCRCI